MGQLKLPSTTNDYLGSLSQYSAPSVSGSLPEMNWVPKMDYSIAMNPARTGLTFDPGNAYTNIGVTNTKQGTGSFWGDFGQAWKDTPMLGGIDKATGQSYKGKVDYGLAAFNSGVNAFLGLKNYGLAKKQFDFQRGAWNKEFATQAGFANARMADIQDRRNAEAGNMYALTGVRTNPQDTASYMAKYGVKV